MKNHNFAVENGRIFVKGEETNLHKRIISLYKSDREFAEWLLKHGEMEIGFKAPEGELRQKIEEGKLKAEDSRCFRDTQEAYMEVDGYTVYEGWVQVGLEKPVRHSWRVDESGNVIDLSFWKHSYVMDIHKFDRETDFLYFGIPLPVGIINRQNQINGYNMLYKLYNTLTNSQKKDELRTMRDPEGGNFENTEIEVEEGRVKLIKNGEVETSFPNEEEIVSKHIEFYKSIKEENMARRLGEATGHTKVLENGN